MTDADVLGISRYGSKRNAMGGTGKMPNIEPFALTTKKLGRDNPILIAAPMIVDLRLGMQSHEMHVVKLLHYAAQDVMNALIVCRGIPCCPPELGGLA